MPWTLLFFAGLFEIGWAIGLKYTDGFTRPLPTARTVGAMLASIALLGLAMKDLPVGTAYAVWTGIGSVGTVILGIMLLGESAAAAARVRRVDRARDRRAQADGLIVSTSCAARSYAYARHSNAASPCGRPISCKPIGSPSALKPAGTLMHGKPAKVA